MRKLQGQFKYILNQEMEKKSLFVDFLHKCPAPTAILGGIGTETRDMISCWITFIFGKMLELMGIWKTTSAIYFEMLIFASQIAIVTSEHCQVWHLETKSYFWFVK